MRSLTIEEPNERQRLFLTATEKYVGFGGARGGGKSWAVRTKAILLAVKYDGIRILIVRKTYKELINNHINILRSQLYGIAKYNDTNKVLAFPNGSTIEFQYCQCDADLDRVQGVEWDVVFFDEATLLSEKQLKTFVACIRGVNGFPKRAYFTANPNGQGMQYFKRIFIDRRYEDNENPEEFRFIQSLVTDNKILMEQDPDYIKQLEALPHKMRQAWLYGDWNVLEGQFFEEFTDNPDHYKDRQNTHVIEPFEIPSGWEIYRSFDWGYAKPFSCGWWAVDYDGVVYRILELYGCTREANEGVKWTPDQVFGEIHKIETEHRWLKGKNIQGVADPAIWNAEYGESIAETAARHQVFFTKGDHQRLPGWMQCHYRMTFDKNGYPMMYIFNTCKAFIRTIPLLCYDERKPEDLDSDMEDHVADEMRYFLMSRPIKPRMAEEPDKYKQGPLYQFLDIEKEDLESPKTHNVRMEIIDDGRDKRRDNDSQSE